MAAKVTIDVAAEFKGKKAFKQADDSVGGLEKGVKKLAKTFAGVFAAQKVLAFGKASAQAFMEDQKSVAILANTVKNLGLEFEMPRLNSFIDNLSKTAGVADDVLRPALQTLLTTTGSAAKSQELLTQAIEISRGSGVELSTVVQDLNNAFLGNTKGLKKYNIGLTQAELKTASFSKIQEKLNAQFSGSSAAYLKTYAGQMDVLTTAAGEAQETIGKGLFDALQILAGEDTNILNIADAFQKMADNIANVSVGLAVLAEKISSIPLLDKLLQLLKWAATTGIGATAAKFLGDLGEKARNPATGASTIDDYNMTADGKAAAAARKKAEDLAAKRAKDLAAATAKNTAEIKKQAALKKDSGVFDEQRINLIAALKGQLSEDDRKRAELQLALLDGNLTEADKLTKQILLSQDATGKLYAYFLQKPDAKNPFGYLDQWIKDFQAKLDALKFPDPPSPLAPVSPSDRARLLAPIGNGASTIGDYLDGVGSIPDTNVPSGVVPNFIPDTSRFGTPTGPVQGPMALTITGEGPLTNAIAQSLQNSSLSTGNAAYINRRTGGFE